MTTRENISDTPWAGDDQAWWDWYMSLANNPPIDPVRVEPWPVRPQGGAASDQEVLVSLGTPYPLTGDAVEYFRVNGYVRLPNVIPHAVLASLFLRANRLLDREHGSTNPGRFLALEQVWLTDPLMRGVALSRRLGDIAAQLMGVDSVRLYHDNILSKEPGCGRTPWHRDSHHYPLDTSAVCTSWVPLHPIPASMGPLACLPRGDAADALGTIPLSIEDRSYDDLVEAALRSMGATPDATEYAAGDVSFHAVDCFHTAGPNHTTTSRRVLSSTYYAEGSRVVEQPTVLSGSWTTFLPGVEPGGLALSPLNPVVGWSPST
ncbi:phytanoyl-CoA dioxygenase family protein [Nocardia sp. NPDC051570]|uniref:phytanoyl-CoA dioxygenase family protein n=1 Tax=Nocardia sp. NPDC051570 TaxID=3364324 RepID=UPI0037B6B719